MDSFQNASYLTQVRRIHLLALEALKQYPIKIKNIQLKRYAANTVYKVIDTRGKAFQLRIHPYQGHTKQAIQEEIKWLNHIDNKTDIQAPKPIKAKNGQCILECQHQSVPTRRFCELFTWMPGRKRWKSINIQYACDLGSMIARLQISGRKISVKHRDYWDVDGLVGTTKAKYFNVEKLTNVTKRQQSYITEARKYLFRKIKQYQNENPHKSGLIHGDIQPNNILYNDQKMAVIDFDDCGVGLYAYDIATALHAFDQVVKNTKAKSYNSLQDSLFEGYACHMDLSKDDLDIIPDLILALRLVTIAWLERHKGNKGLGRYYQVAIKEAIQGYKQLER